MSKKIIRALLLEGLDCANCAAKIEAKVNSIKAVDKASMNFTTKTLSIEVDNIGLLDEVLEETREIINRLEPHVIVREKIIEKQEKKTLILMGLNCANCANKIESEVKNLAGVNAANVNFINKKLTIEINNKNEAANIIEEVRKIAAKIEPNVVVVEEGHIEEKAADSTDTEKSKEGPAENNKKELARLGIAAALFIIAAVFDFSDIIELFVYLVLYIFIGGEVLLKSVRNITRGEVFDENFLMSIATIGAFAIGEYPEGVAVMLFYQIGEFFQGIAVNRSRKSIAALMDIRPDFANLKAGDDTRRVSPEEVNIGALIVVKPGEKVPLDGKVVEGKSMLDTSALTGESVPREVEEGNDVLGGFINKNGLLTVEVTKEFGESTVSRILDMVQNASSKKSPTENFITKFARYYTPAVVFIALGLAVIPPLAVPGAVFSDWLYRALVFLVVSCPCALVISIPLSFFGGIGGASKNGVLIKGSNYLEALNNVDTVVFDKTGTLTKGVFKVTGIEPVSIEQGELLEFAAYAESYSNHPIAVSILKAYGKEINKSDIENYYELSGYGIKVKVKGREVLAGNTKLMCKEDIAYECPDTVGTVVHIAIDGKYAGYLIISDEVKEDSEKAIKELKKAGVRKAIMLTGDIKSVGQKVGEKLGLDEVHAELLPDQKVEKLEEIEKQKPARGKLVFVGDGINDAPVLARADIGIAMGGLGSDAAIEAADVVIMTDEPSKIVSAIRIAKRTRGIVWQNIIFAMGIKLIVLALGAGGIATIWEAVFADVGVTLIAVINSMRVMNVKSMQL